MAHERKKRKEEKKKKDGVVERDERVNAVMLYY